MMAESSVHAEEDTRSAGLLADGLALVYHEGRNVRHLVRAGHVDSRGWEVLLSLPTNRVEAWRAILGLRLKASAAPNRGNRAARVFEQHFRKTLEDLEALYENEHWKHAAAVGGHAWRVVTSAVLRLRDALVSEDRLRVGEAANSLVAARHNNGYVRHKIRELDRAVGHQTGTWWPEDAGA